MEEEGSDDEDKNVDSKRGKGSVRVHVPSREELQRLLKSSSEFNSEEEKDEGPSPKIEKVLSKKERIKILKTQKVLTGRAFDPTYAHRPGMRDIVDDVAIQV